LRVLFALAQAPYPDRSGATSIEYALIIALVALAVAAATNTVGYEVSSLMYNISNDLARLPLTEPPPPVP
jgi:Flp pilus assembly pilin Flp